MPGFFERIQARIDLFRLEQRYTRNRNRRSTFASNAIYVDGEYIYQTPVTTGSSTNSASTSSSNNAQASSRNAQAQLPATTPSAGTDKPGKRLNRFSAMPGFGSLSRATGQSVAAQDRRSRRASIGGMR